MAKQLFKASAVISLVPALAAQVDFAPPITTTAKSMPPTIDSAPTATCTLQTPSLATVNMTTSLLPVDTTSSSTATSVSISNISLARDVGMVRYARYNRRMRARGEVQEGNSTRSPKIGDIEPYDWDKAIADAKAEGDVAVAHEGIIPRTCKYEDRHMVWTWKYYFFYDKYWVYIPCAENHDAVQGFFARVRRAISFACTTPTHIVEHWGGERCMKTESNKDDPCHHGYYINFNCEVWVAQGGPGDNSVEQRLREIWGSERVTWVTSKKFPWEGLKRDKPKEVMDY